MFSFIIKKIIGTKNERELKRIRPIVDKINALEPKIQKLSDDELKAFTPKFKQRIENGESLDDILPEAFAVVREVARRTLGMRHFDVQLMGGIVLHEGKIAEMKTGEGKTLVATLPAYLNALEGKGVHIVTVNDYLAKRDAEWMGVIYRFLGLTVGVITHDMDDDERKKAYMCDITYGTNNEFGFDYLRDNMKYSIDDMVQRDLHYAIVDEVDSILIDEARTPLIISGPAEESTGLYYRMDKVVRKLKRDEDFEIDEKERTVTLTDKGISKLEKLLGVDNLYDPKHMDLIHHAIQGLRARHLYKRDVDYVVKDGKVIIVDEFTGRLMPGRRYGEGLHQALEAKEGLKVESENQTLATITFQNYFRMYKKLAGMTGTAETEAAEFKQIYNLDVVVIPTNKPMIRKDYPDVVFRTEREKFEAVVKEIEECHRRGQPVLVGTVSIEKSEKLSSMLKKRGIPHHVLNAKHHAKEAEIIAQAGRKGAVTISTNMAGRGTDIILGGNPEYLAAAKVGWDRTSPKFKEQLEFFKKICEKEREEVIKQGGLHVIGTERHESRRIDNQLRGRSGRQGDPGSSRFYLSLEDDLLRIFGGDRIKGLMDRLGIEEGEPIEHPILSKAIENAQKRVEAYHFEIRKHLLEYDDVMNKQREVIYSLRKEILRGEDMRDTIMDMLRDVASMVVSGVANGKVHPSEWDFEELKKRLHGHFRIDVDSNRDILGSSKEEAEENIFELLKKRYEEKEKELSPEVMRALERFLLLQSIDYHWRDHLLAMDYLREGIGLRGYGQKDPLIEYKKEGYNMFLEMLDSIKMDTISKLFLVKLERDETLEIRREVAKDISLERRDIVGESMGEEKRVTKPIRRKGRKIGRNDPCPCGSGKKYKNCCGRYKSGSTYA